jgi:hypothetical protein
MPSPRTRTTDPRRGVIQLVDGRQVSGFPPGHARNSGGRSIDLFLAHQHGCPATEAVEEHHVRDDLARQVGGLIEARLPLGFADVVTGQAVFEVESRHSWREGSRQVLAYAAQCGLPPALALFRAISAAEMLAIFSELRAIDLHGLRSDFIDLWWWTGQAWQQITNPSLCADMPNGAVFGSCAYCGCRVAWFDGSTICYDYDPTHRIRQMHCCAGLCPGAHDSVELCLYWAARRAFPDGNGGSGGDRSDGLGQGGPACREHFRGKAMLRSSQSRSEQEQTRDKEHWQARPGITWLSRAW